MSIIDVNWLAIVFSVIIFMFVGSLWYSPKLFGRKWMEAKGLTPEEITHDNKAYAGAALNAFIMALALAHFIHYTGAETAFDGMCVAFWAWLGFIVTANFSAVLWENQPFTVFLINISGMFVSLLAVGALLAAW